MCMYVCVCYIYVYIYFSKLRKHFRKPSVLKPEPYLWCCSYGSLAANAAQHIAKFCWLALLIVRCPLSNHRAGEAAGLQAVWGDARGARWGEGPQRARDPESEGAPEAGHGCSAGGTESGQQPGPLRVGSNSDGLTGSREQHSSQQPCVWVPPRVAIIRGSFSFSFFLILRSTFLRA